MQTDVRPHVLRITLCASAAFARVSVLICRSGICWPAASCQLAVKMSGDDKICFPIHSYSPHARTALERHQLSLRAFMPVFRWQQDGASHAFPEGLAFVWLSSAAQARHSCHPLSFTGTFTQPCPRLGSPQHTADSLLLRGSSASSQTDTIMWDIIATSLYLQDKQTPGQQAPVVFTFLLPGLCTCLLQYLPLGI